MATVRLRRDFQGLTQNRGEGFGGELVELIHVEVEVAAILLGNIRPAHGGQLDTSHKEGAQQRRGRPRRSSPCSG